SSFMLALASDASKLDGLNTSAALIDELHEHPTPKAHDKIMTSTGSRSEPLVMKITTAGRTTEGVCRDQYEYTEKVLSSVIEDDSFFGFVAEADADLAWDSDEAIIQANPNFGVSVSADYLRRERNKARNIPSY